MLGACLGWMLYLAQNTLEMGWTGGATTFSLDGARTPREPEKGAQVGNTHEEA